MKKLALIMIAAVLSTYAHAKEQPLTDEEMVASFKCMTQLKEEIRLHLGQTFRTQEAYFAEKSAQNESDVTYQLLIPDEFHGRKTMSQWEVSFNLKTCELVRFHSGPESPPVFKLNGDQ